MTVCIYRYIHTTTLYYWGSFLSFSPYKTSFSSESTSAGLSFRGVLTTLQNKWELNYLLWYNKRNLSKLQIWTSLRYLLCLQNLTYTTLTTAMSDWLQILHGEKYGRLLHRLHERNFFSFRFFCKNKLKPWWSSN